MKRKNTLFVRRTTYDEPCGLYIHIPFCRCRCPYCDFYSIVYKADKAAEYVDIVTKQVKKLNNKFHTVYIGGGTPSVLDTRLLRKLLGALSSHFSHSVENTIEANPESLTKEKIRVLRSQGINRISIGVQSLRDDKLKSLGRVHAARNARTAVDNAKRGGFTNIGIDLIYGVPGERFSEWKKELTEVVKLPVKHISCYSLICEKGTHFYRLRDSIDDDIVAKMYRYNMRFFKDHGFVHYEVSNYAKQTFVCVHNCLYWANASYIGIGASAVSYIDQVRIKNIADVNQYIKRAGNNRSLILQKEKLSTVRRAKETAALNIRRSDGIDFEEFKQITGFDFWQIEDHQELERCIREKLLRFRKKGKEKSGIALTDKGFLYADSVSSALL